MMGLVNSRISHAVLRNHAALNPQMFFGWNINHISRMSSGLQVNGWALPLDGLLDNTVLYCNGVRAEMQYMSDAVVGNIFPAWPNASMASFKAVWPRLAGDRAEGLLVFDIRSADGSMLPAKHRMMFDFSDEAVIQVPDAELVAHIGPTPPQMFIQTGRTLAMQFDAALRTVSGKGFESQTAILEWGCGPARVLQHVKHLYGGGEVTTTGIDVDSVAIDWCKSRLSGIEFKTCELNPPVDYPDSSFDVVYAYSVLTHLRKQDAGAWVKEINRVLRPGGHFIFTTLGTSSLAWLHPHGNQSIEDALNTNGIYDGAKNTDIDSVISDKDYYRNTWVTDAYTRNVWGAGFDVVLNEACFHHYQDMWVLRKP
ncbi:class I SAM-dependent methyltransferase [Mesorhizobium sp.]|uniref:class I SAM-dependent methyltransferase n=1 Tax=Mesorhizobium sp. TaxID=1871066 RepID=UPI000FE66122|nr:class I SAM-dependent methyltransferase [Mesorhizobium sp.]RWP83402.1 MAG: class I SAM-dependent methyltransferase [Mesorhizobium sp.]